MNAARVCLQYTMQDTVGRKKKEQRLEKSETQMMTAGTNVTVGSRVDGGGVGEEGGGRDSESIARDGEPRTCPLPELTFMNSALVGVAGTELEPPKSVLCRPLFEPPNGPPPLPPATPEAEADP